VLDACHKRGQQPSQLERKKAPPLKVAGHHLPPTKIEKKTPGTKTPTTSTTCASRHHQKLDPRKSSLIKNPSLPATSAYRLLSPADCECVPSQQFSFVLVQKLSSFNTMNVAPPPPIAPAAPQLPGVAAAVAPPPLVPGVPGPPSTFTELYNVPAADAHGGVYSPILALFATEPAAGRRTPAEIRAALDAAGDAFLQAYLLLGNDGRTVMIHTITRYPTLPGQVTQWDGA